MQSENVRETYAWLRERGFIVGRAPLDCGHAPSARDPEDSIGATGVAYTADNRSMCYACADAATRETMRTADSVVLYLHASGNVTTWSGGIMGRVASRTERSCGGFARRYKRTYVRVTDLDGREWYGSGPGDGMYIRLRARRVTTG